MHDAVARRSRLSRYAARASVVLLLPVPLVLSTTPAAHAAGQPWRFTTAVSGFVSIAPSSEGTAVATCPEGYFPIGGGVKTAPNTSTFTRVSEYRDGSTYRVTFRIGATGVNMGASVQATCVHVSSVTPVKKTDVMIRLSSGMAGGVVRCDDGWRAISGGAEWTGTSPTREIVALSPTTDGTGWYVSGYNGTAADLYLDAYCVPAADLGVSPTFGSLDYSSTTTVDRPMTCHTDRRAVSGGVLFSSPGTAPNPFEYRGYSFTSFPAVVPRWEARVKAITDLGPTRVTTVAWCLPVSVPDVTFTSYPPAQTTSRDAAFTFTVTNPAGEPATSIGCRMDNSGPWQPCSSGQFSFSNVTDGTHQFSVEVITPSGIWQEHHGWTVDATKPTASGPPPNASITGPLTVTFSEKVTNVTADTMKVTQSASTTPLAGSIVVTPATGGATTASWTPTSPLVPGDTYTVSLTAGIADLAGNALTPVGLGTRTSLVVDSASPAWKHYWDRDTSTYASGGATIASPAIGATATWAFTATAGQTAALHGTRLPDGGYAEVWLDGVKKAQISSYASATQWKAKLYTSPALTAGRHTLQVRTLGTKSTASKGTWVALDYVAVGTTLLQETTSRQTFRRVAHASASGGSYDHVTHKTTGDTGGGPSYLMTFRGTGATLYVTKSTNGGSAKIYVDSVLKATVSTNSGGTFFQQGAFTVSGLTDARHSIRVVLVGTSTGGVSTVAVDYLTAIAAPSN
jgi:hypothetical protein